MRSLVKRSLELTLMRSGVGALGRMVRGREMVVLAYHNIVPSADPPTGDSTLHLGIDDFMRQLDALEAICEIIPVREMITGDLTGRGRRLAAITFDDAYRGALSLGIGELVARGLPATVFVCPGLMGSNGFWWDVLAGPGWGGVEASARDYALGPLGGRQEPILAWADDQGMATDPLPDLYQAATSEEVEAVSSLSGIELGSHTWSHVNLTSVSSGVAFEELTRPLEWLTDGGHPSAGQLTYPYGQASPAVASMAMAAGYENGFLVRGGLMREAVRTRTPYEIPRMNIPRGLSAEGFAARVSGVWPR